MNWDKYFIEMLSYIASKSKDRSTKVGSVIVGKNNNILSTGYNGFPRGVIEDINDVHPQGNESYKYWCEEIEKRHQRPEKYLRVEHSERNSIYNAARHGVSLDGSRIYVDWIPCCDCARAIIQSGISIVIIDARDEEAKETYWNERWKENLEVSKTMLQESNVKLIRYKEE